MDAINTLFTSLAGSFTSIALAVAALSFVIGALIYMTAWGSSRQKEMGKTAMIDTLLGLALVLGARSIIGLITGALGSGV